MNELHEAFVLKPLVLSLLMYILPCGSAACYWCQQLRAADTWVWRSSRISKLQLH